MCERLFRDTRVRVSTDDVGLAKHPEGLELVRIGQPMRPEFAAWRYGDQFGRRRKRALIYGGVGLAAFLGLNFVGSFVIGVSGLGGYYVWQGFEALKNARTQAKLRTDDGRVIKLKRGNLLETRLRPSHENDGFRLSILNGKKQEWFEGSEAERFAGQIIPRMNQMGGKKRTVQDAVSGIASFAQPRTTPSPKSPICWRYLPRSLRPACSGGVSRARRSVRSPWLRRRTRGARRSNPSGGYLAGSWRSQPPPSTLMPSFM